MVSSAEGFVSLEPNGDLAATYNVRLEKGVAKVSAERPFQIFLGNFAKFERQMPKGMVIAHAINSPLTLLIIGEDLVRELAM